MGVETFRMPHQARLTRSKTPKAGPVAKNRSLWRLGAHDSGACVAVARYGMGDFKWRHFRGEIILWAVRWSCKYGISYRELEEMMTERGVAVDHRPGYP